MKKEHDNTLLLDNDLKFCSFCYKSNNSELRIQNKNPIKKGDKMETIAKNEEQKKQWKKPIANKLDIATITKSGPFRAGDEDPFFNFYGPVS